VANEKVSVSAARSRYRVVIREDGSIDEEGTHRARQR
jgi:hypothetical protein